MSFLSPFLTLTTRGSCGKTEGAESLKSKGMEYEMHWSAGVTEGVVKWVEVNEFWLYLLTNLWLLTIMLLTLIKQGGFIEYEFQFFTEQALLPLLLPRGIW